MGFSPKSLVLISRCLYLICFPFPVLHRRHFLHKIRVSNPFGSSLLVGLTAKSPLLYEISAFLWSFPQWSGIYEGIPELCGRVLQIGSGTGLFNRYCRAEGKRYRLVNMDLNPRYLRWGRRYRRMTRCVCADALELPFARQSFDTLLFTRCFHHIRKPKKVFRECSRVLRPGGRIIISDPVALYLNGRDQAGRDQAERGFMVNSDLDGLIWRYSPGAFLRHIGSALPPDLSVAEAGFSRPLNLSNYNYRYPHMDSLVVIRKRR